MVRDVTRIILFASSFNNFKFICLINIFNDYSERKEAVEGILLEINRVKTSSCKFPTRRRKTESLKTMILMIDQIVDPVVCFKKNNKQTTKDSFQERRRN